MKKTAIKDDSRRFAVIWQEFKSDEPRPPIIKAASRYSNNTCDISSAIAASPFHHIRMAVDYLLNRYHLDQNHLENMAKGFLRKAASIPKDGSLNHDDFTHKDYNGKLHTNSFHPSHHASDIEYTAQLLTNKNPKLFLRELQNFSEILENNPLKTLIITGFLNSRENNLTQDEYETIKNLTSHQEQFNSSINSHIKILEAMKHAPSTLRYDYLMNQILPALNELDVTTEKGIEARQTLIETALSFPPTQNTNHKPNDNTMVNAIYGSLEAFNDSASSGFARPFFIQNVEAIFNLTHFEPNLKARQHAILAAIEVPLPIAKLDHGTPLKTTRNPEATTEQYRIQDHS